MKRMGVVVSPTGTPVALETVTVKNHATGTVHSTSATNAAGRWDADIADETQAYRVEIGGASGGTQRVVQAPASIELEWLFVRYGMKVAGGPVDFGSATSVALPPTVTMGGAALDTRYVNVTGDVMTGALAISVKGNQFGTAGGPGATTPVAPADANIRLYDFGSGNWAGFGADGGGSFWLRTGLSGTPPPSLTIDPNANVSIQRGGNLTVTGGMTATGQVLAGGGSAATPGFAFVGDENTGLFRNNEGGVSLVSNGTIRLSSTVTGADVQGGLGISGVLTVGSTLGVTGAATMNGGLTLAGGLNVTTGGLNVAAGGATLRGGTSLVSSALNGEPVFAAHNLAFDGNPNPTFDNLVFSVDHDAALRFKVLWLPGLGYNTWGAAPTFNKLKIAIKNEHGGIVGYVPIYV